MVLLHLTLSLLTIPQNYYSKYTPVRIPLTAATPVCQSRGDSPELLLQPLSSRICCCNGGDIVVDMFAVLLLVRIVVVADLLDEVRDQLKYAIVVRPVIRRALSFVHLSNSIHSSAIVRCPIDCRASFAGPLRGVRSVGGVCDGLGVVGVVRGLRLAGGRGVGGGRVTPQQEWGCDAAKVHHATHHHPAPPPAYGGATTTTYCGPDCPALHGSHHSVDVCSATPSRPAYGRGVPSWSDGRGRGSGSTHSVAGGWCGGVLETGLGPLEPLLPPLPPELEEHLRTCRCTCNHMGYGNYQGGASPHHASVQSEELPGQYQVDADFALNIRMLPALAFIPHGEVVDAFNTLQENMQPKANPVIEYFEDTYIGRQRRHNRRAPRFPVSMWNIYDRVAAVAEDLLRTKNS
ncbi:hypothetical protein Hamer_G003854 [Homarus americanus]|uniref:Uncharacterized protein n=1 Tax=Homarus americanus TaxID=6706 RepID=A0A8J5NFM8_HOMAM|nr:hypothetical protein Hamer_G003854 [Homarus americanus]